MITVAVFAVIFFSNEDKSLDTYLLGGFIITQVLLFMVDQIFQNMRGTRNDLKEHTKSINEIYKLLTLVSIEQGRRQEPWKYFLKFPKEYKSSMIQFREEPREGRQFEKLYEDDLEHDSVYDYYKSAIEHLKHKKYKRIYDHLENTKNLLDELNGKTSIEERLEDRIKEKMDKYFPALQSFTSGTKPSDHYDTYNIMQFMIRCFRYPHVSKTAANELVCGKSAEVKFVCVESAEVKFVCKKLDSNYRYITVKSDSEIDFDTFKKLLKEIQEDGSLKDFYNEYANEHNNIIKELTGFQEKLKNTVKELKIKPLIEGKCSGCP